MKKFKNILILAGGDSTRFWPLKDKVFYSFIGKTFIQHVYDEVINYAEKVTVVSGESVVKSNIRLLKSAEVIPQDNMLDGMAGAILSAKNKIKGEVLILNSSDIFNFEVLLQYVNKLKYSKPDVILLAKKVEEYFPGGYLNLVNNKINQIVEKPARGKEPSNLVKLVLDYFGDFNQLINSLENIQTKSDDLYEKAINQLLTNTDKSDYVLYDDYWQALKYPWHVLSLMALFLTSLKKEIIMGKNVKIAKTAKIEGPCFIGDNTIIGDFALVRQSHIGKNCLIGAYSEVTRSYLGNNVFLHRNYIGDSVLADNVLFGAGAVTANFRFDQQTIKSQINGKKLDTNLTKLGAIIGEGAKIGVNSTLLPGIKIGSKTYIAPGHIISEDVKDKMFVRKGLIKNKHTS